MSVQETSTETAIRRKRGVDDALKRAAYRKAHGTQGTSVINSWGLGIEEEKVPVGPDDAAVGAPVIVEGNFADGKVETVTGNEGNERACVDFNVRKKPRKWLGIW